MAPFIGGAEVAAERLALGLCEEGHEVVVVLGKRGEVMDRMEKAGLRCLFSPMYFTDKWHWLRYFRARQALRRLLKHERPDLIHSNDLPTHQIVADAAQGLGIPRICHHRFPFDGRTIDWLNKYGAEHHLFVSRALMEEMAAQSGRLRGGARSVVHDGLALPALPTDELRRQARQRLGLGPERTLVTFAGQIIERKGVADLLRAWSSLAESDRSGAELLVVGDDLQGQGRYRGAMEKLAAELHCPARFAGFQKNVGDWLLASDVAVVPSHVEPLGNATLEAMSYALPVIGSAVGGIPEMIVPDQTGLLIPPHAPDLLAAALRGLLADRETRKRCGSLGRQRCEERFSLQAHTRSVLKEYEQTLHRTNNARVS
jgi:glycosyltransferase involved in cell wall biosynthesis